MPALNTVDILLNGVVVAESVQLEYCMVFTRSLFDAYYNDPDVVVTIRKHEDGTDGLIGDEDFFCAHGERTTT